MGGGRRKKQGPLATPDRVPGRWRRLFIGYAAAFALLFLGLTALERTDSGPATIPPSEMVTYSHQPPSCSGYSSSTCNNGSTPLIDCLKAVDLKNLSLNELLKFKYCLLSGYGYPKP